MDIKKLAPWNWFKKEDDENSYDVPVKVSSRDTDNLFSSKGIKGFNTEIDRIFDSFFDGFGGFGSAGVPGALSGGFLKPSLDLGGNDKEYSLSVEVPGVSEKDVKIEVDGDTLTISGEKKKEKEEKEKNFYRLERSYGSFKRTLSLPVDADRDNIDAVFKDGVLKVSIPRTKDSQDNSRKIEIKYAS